MERMNVWQSIKRIDIFNLRSEKSLESSKFFILRKTYAYLRKITIQPQSSLLLHSEIPVKSMCLSFFAIYEFQSQTLGMRQDLRDLTISYYILLSP